MPLAAQRGQPRVTDAGDLEVARGTGGYGEHDRVGADLLAGAGVTAHPRDAIAIRETGVARRTSDSPAAMVRATVADPSATRWFSHSATS